MTALLASLGNQSINRQRKAKVVTGAILDFAVRSGTLSSNPVRGSMGVSPPRTEVRALTLADLDTVRAAVHAWMTKDRPGPKSSAGLADIIDLIVGTGARIGEVLALRWCDIDMDAGTIEINGTIKTDTTRDTYRKPTATSHDIELPDFAVALLRRRHLPGVSNAMHAVFPTRNGTWHQVNNVERRWRHVRQEAGLEWVTPHAFRKLAHPES